MHAVVIGGGIAGLTSAIALRQGGWTVAVLEAADDFSEIGAGFGMTANGLTALGTIGLADAAFAASHPLTMSGIRNASGRALMRFDTSASYAGSLRIFGMQRRALHALLLDAASGIDLRHSVRVTDVEVGEPGGALARVTYKLAGSASTIEADLVVGADGINSFVRSVIAPDTVIRYSGMSSWRGIADERTVVDDSFAITWGPDAEFGALRTDSEHVYWYGYVELPRGTKYADEKQAALDRFAGWSSPVLELIERTPAAAVMRHDVYSLARPARHYARGRAVLVGDSAHAMLPTMGQGVNLALEDAATLGRLLGEASAPGVESALRAYDRLRHLRTASIHRRSQLAGAFGSHLKSPTLRAIRDRLVGLTPRSLAASASSALGKWQPPKSR